VADRVRAVLDTQIVFRGLLGRRESRCAEIFGALSDGAFIAVVSAHIIKELRAVFDLPKVRSRYRITDEQVDEFVDAYERIAERTPGNLVLPDDFRAPPEDVPILSAALEGNAEYLVTDDSDFLDLKSLVVSGYRPVEIVAPSLFVRIALS
jgi:putative PIN family toxin of toxin-antitoxin system